VLSEWFGRPDMPLAGSYPVIRDAKVAGYLWALLIVNCNGHWDRPVAEGDPPFQGMLWPNGTAYDDLEEGECMRSQCRTLTYVHHCCNMDPKQDALFNFSSDWEQVVTGPAVYNHAHGPRMGSQMQSNTSGASLVLGPLPGGTARVALYLPTASDGAAYKVNLDGKQIYAGTTVGVKLWEARVVIQIPPSGKQLELIVDPDASAATRFNFSGATFFYGDAPPPTPTPPTPTPPGPTPGPTSCKPQENTEMSGVNLKSLDNPTLNLTVCCAECDAMDECQGWTLNTAQRKCWLKSNISPHPRGGVVSGEKDAPYPGAPGSLSLNAALVV